MFIGLTAGIMASQSRPFSPFSIRQLFNDSEAGVWYDPSDLTTLFQDTAGTTPVTTAGQTVGLMLDKSQGLTLGPELVTNGTFDTDVSGWTVYNPTYGSISAVSGRLRLSQTLGGSGAIAEQVITTVAGQAYVISVDFVTDAVTGNSFIRAGAASGGLELLNKNIGSTTGTTALTFIATGTTTYVSVANSSTSLTSEYSEWDNISVKELPGNHATQPTAAARPTYGYHPEGGIRNLLTQTENFADAVWQVIGATLTTGVDDPNGGTSAVTVVPTGGFGYIVNTSASTVTQQVQSCWLRSTDGAPLDLVFRTAGVLSAVVTVGPEWERFDSGVLADTAMSFRVQNRVDQRSFDVWSAQVDDNTSVTPYQRVGSQYDVTEAGVPSVHYLAFDGVDDFMVTPTITPGIDKVQVFAGVRKLSDSVVASLIETSEGFGDGRFTVFSPTSSLSNIGFASRGSLAVLAVSNLTSPTTNVVSGLSDISGDLATLRIDGTQEAQSTGDQGTGNYLAYPMYIGMRAGTSLPFTGNIYSLVTRFGANLETSTIETTETYVASKTGVTL